MTPAPSSRPSWRRSALALTAALVFVSADAPAQAFDGPLPGGEIDVSWEALGKGANYMVNTTLLRTSEFQFLSFDADPTSGIDGDPLHGTYQPEHVEAELSLLDSYGVDGVRVWGSYYGWRVDGADYTANLRDFVERCDAHGIGIQYVFWSTTGNWVTPLQTTTAMPNSGQQLRNNINTVWSIEIPNLMGKVLSDDPCGHLEPWHLLWREEPEMDLFTIPLASWPTGQAHDIRAYISAVADVFNDFPGLPICYDLFNEPEVTDLVPGSHLIDPDAIDLMAVTVDRLQAKHDSAASSVPFSEVDITVGLSAVDSLHDNLNAMLPHVDLTVVSFHSYGTTSQFSSAVTTAKQQLREYLLEHDLTGMPLVCSEFYYWGGGLTPSEPGTLGEQTAVLDQAGISGYVWGALASNGLDVNHQYTDGLWRMDYLVDDLCDLFGVGTPKPIGTVAARPGFPDPVLDEDAWDDKQAFLNW